MRSSLSVTAKWVNHQVRKPYSAAAGMNTPSPISRVVVSSRIRFRCAPSGSCTAHPINTATGAQARRSGVTGCSRCSTTGFSPVPPPSSASAFAVPPPFSATEADAEAPTSAFPPGPAPASGTPPSPLTAAGSGSRSAPSPGLSACTASSASCADTVTALPIGPRPVA